jgi:hypothetical protein
MRDMLSGDNQQAAQRTISAPPTSGETQRLASDAITKRLERLPRVEWLGQTIASLCWIASVLAYGINTGGDWLQLLAASSWLVANIAAERRSSP